MNCVTVNIIWKLLHNLWTLVLQLEWSALQWILYGNTSQHLYSGIAAWIKCVTMNITWKVLYRKWKLLFQLEWCALQWSLHGRYLTAGGHWYCSLNEVRCSEYYIEGTSQQVDSSIAAWMNCVTVSITWMVLYRMWKLVFQLEWIVLQWTLYGRYFTANGQFYCSLNEVCYSEHYMESTLQHVDSVIAAWKKCVSVNIIWNILHSMWPWYFSLNEVRFIEQYVEGTSQQVETYIAAWMKCVSVNIIWKVLHSRWTLLLHLEWSALQLTLYGRYFIAVGHWYCCLNEVRYNGYHMEDTSQHVDPGIAASMKCISMNIIWKVLHSKWTILFQLKWIALHWTLYGRYFTGSGHWYCCLNEVCYNE